jgi:hypothetical protein
MTRGDGIPEFSDSNLGSGMATILDGPRGLKTGCFHAARKIFCQRREGSGIHMAASAIQKPARTPEQPKT